MAICSASSGEQHYFSGIQRKYLLNRMVICLQRLAADSIAFVSLACICYHSSYYNAPVDVAIDKCEHIGDGVYDRAVTLSVAGVKFCVAKSIVTLHSTVCKELVDNKVSHISIY
jgi:hypothetical protein